MDKGADDSQNSLQHMRKAHIERILAMADGDIDEAAQLLGLPVSKLRVWMRKLDIAERQGVPNRDERRLDRRLDV